MSVDVDPLEHGTQSIMVLGAAAARAGETVLRQAQDARLRRSVEAAKEASDLAEKMQEQAKAAERLYAGLANDPTWLNAMDAVKVRTIVYGAHVWADADPERFDAHAARLREQIAVAYGLDLTDAWNDSRNADVVADLAADRAESLRGALDYDSAEAREARAAALVDAGIDPVAVEARVVSDQQNGVNPAGAAAWASSGRTPATARPRRTLPRTSDQQRGR